MQPPAPTPAVVFGVRPCDARAALAVKALFLSKAPSDGQYARHREAMYYPEDVGPLDCVGCGRCIDACPVNIDILEVIAAVEQMAV